MIHIRASTSRMENSKIQIQKTLCPMCRVHREYLVGQSGQRVQMLTKPGGALSLTVEVHCGLVQAGERPRVLL